MGVVVIVVHDCAQWCDRECAVRTNVRRVSEVDWALGTTYEAIVETGALVLLDAEIALGDSDTAALARTAGRRGVLDAGVGGCHSLPKGDREKERHEGAVVRRVRRRGWRQPRDHARPRKTLKCGSTRVSDGCRRGAGRAKKKLWRVVVRS